MLPVVCATALVLPRTAHTNDIIVHSFRRVVNTCMVQLLLFAAFREHLLTVCACTFLVADERQGQEKDLCTIVKCSCFVALSNFARKKINSKNI